MRHEPGFLRDPALRLLLFGGKGGVGKTTCAAGAAVQLALRSPDARFLLVSVDPAHSLLDCMAGEPPPQNLDVLELNAESGLAAFTQKHGETLKEIARRGTFLDEADIDRFVNLSLPGLDELIAFLRIAEWTAQQTYRTIIVDTAPSGHTLRLLGMPALMRSWLDALDALLGKYRYMKRLFRGSYRPDAPDHLLLDLVQATQRMQTLLRSEQACFVPVFLAEVLSLDETKLLLTQLTELQVRIGPLVCNRIAPAETTCATYQHGREAQQRALETDGGFLQNHEVWAIPFAPREVRGRAALEGLWESAAPLQTTDRTEYAPQAVAAPEPRVTGPLRAPEPTVSLLLFAGKGGVGKTTLACAAALRLSETPVDRPVILLSTDPAHSIGACLQVPVGPQAQEVHAGLRVMTLDAAHEWQSWQERYRDELQELLSESLPSMDLTFDRQVMERLMALCPPGMDEIMALTRITELLAEQPHALLIVDTAPTGHLLRLLSMPEVLDGWLKSFFAMLLKYRSILRMPRLSDQLIALSKRLKALRALLRDATRAQVVAVAIPTELSAAETADLLSACERIALSVAGLVVNQCTPASSCPSCTARAHAEAGVVAALRTRAAAAHVSRVSQVSRGEPPLGLDAVAALGRALYPEATSVSSDREHSEASSVSSDKEPAHA